MFSVQEARERILSHFQSTTIESVPLINCDGRVLAIDITAEQDLPTFDNSSMDGFAIRAEDSGNATLKVVADIPAGIKPLITIKQGEAARIMTGAQMPEGASAVIPVEFTNFDHQQPGSKPPNSVSFNKEMKSGDNVRARGTDLRAGDTVLQKGRVLRPQDLGMLATLGIGSVQVHKKPKVALMSSGDELIDVSEPLQEGKIRDSNSFMLAALIESTGAEVIRLGVARDNRGSVEGLLRKAIEANVDLIVSSAGVSVGAFDFIKEVVQSKGNLDFWKVNMRPGKPLAFGEYMGKPFIGLPGNPVSAFVGFEVFGRPTLEKLGGQKNVNRPRVRVRAGEEFTSDGRESYLRVRILEEDGFPVVYLTGHQGSGNLLSISQADALLIIPAGVKCVPAGQEVEAIKL